MPTGMHLFPPITGFAENLLDETTIGSLLTTALSRGGEFADIFIQETQSSSLVLEEGCIRRAGLGKMRGAGIRVIKNGCTGFGYSDDFDVDRLKDAAFVAAFAADDPGASTSARHLEPKHYPDVNPVAVAPDQVLIKDKIDLLTRADNAARKSDPRIIQVHASYGDSISRITVADSEGLLVSDRRVMCRLSVGVVAEEKGRRERGFYGGGGRTGFDHFETLTPETAAEEAVRKALVMLDAVEAPAGPQTVVLGNGWAGILLHEAVGHGLEADYNRKGTSLYTGRLGEKVASELCTVVDQGNLPNRRGSLTVDDEGTPTRRNVLIENGILRGYLVDRLNGKLMKMEPTGNGRRQSFKHFPLPRMTNTFLMPGEFHPEEIIRSVKRGFYAKSFGGGQVDISNGNFVFNVTEGYLIEDGRVTAPVKGAALIGSGPEVLKKVVMVGGDFTLDPGIGTCGKSGQGVPVGVGQPHIKISEITVGGTAVPGTPLTP
jgi:TldD protein